MIDTSCRGITSAESSFASHFPLIRPIAREEFRDLLIDSPMGLLFASTTLCRGSFEACYEDGYFWFDSLSMCIDLRDYDGIYGPVEGVGTFRGEVYPRT